MADSTVHALISGTTPADTDEFYIARSPFSAGDDVKLTWAQLKAAVTLSGVLTAGNDAGGQNIVNVGDINLAGLTGATAGARFAGGTTSGAPIAGTFSTGDFVVDRSGAIHVCTAGGTPGTWVSVSGSAGLAAVYGDGSDGAAAFDGVTTHGFATLSGSRYSLNRDCWLASATIASGVTIYTNGFRIYCAGAIVGTDATSLIDGSGGDGNQFAPNGGSGMSNGTSSINTNSSGASQLGTNGGSGATGAGSTVSGSVTLISIGGAGGNGGAGTGGAGGSGGTVPSLPTTTLQPRSLAPAMSLIGMRAGGGAISYVTLQGGAGGGGGGGDTTNPGGGGGGGGGIVPVYASSFSGSGSIKANGGKGAAPSAGGNCGGGGGGGGGAVVVVSSSVSGGAIPGWTCTASAGSGGAASGTGGAGSPGSSGNVYLIPN